MTALAGSILPPNAVAAALTVFSAALPSFAADAVDTVQPAVLILHSNHPSCPRMPHPCQLTGHRDENSHAGAFATIEINCLEAQVRATNQEVVGSSPAGRANQTQG